MHSSVQDVQLLILCLLLRVHCSTPDIFQGGVGGGGGGGGGGVESPFWIR